MTIFAGRASLAVTQDDLGTLAAIKPGQMGLSGPDWRLFDVEAHSPLLSDVEFFLPRAPILSAAETARIMGFPTCEALNKARQTGRLPIPMFQLPGRRGWFAARHVVKAWLEGALVGSSSNIQRLGEGADMSG